MPALPGAIFTTKLTGSERVAIDTGGSNAVETSCAAIASLGGAPPGTSLTIVGPETAAQGFTLSARDALTTFPVPTLRPTTVNTGLAFDLMPNGAPGNNADAPLSVCWFDVCNADVLHSGGNVGTCRVGCGTVYAEIGSYAFGSQTQLPLIFTLSGTVVGEFTTAGNYDFKPIVANGQCYVHMGNAGVGTGAYNEMGVYNSYLAPNGFFGLRVYSTGWTAVPGLANWASLTAGTSLAGMDISTNTGPILFLTGGYTHGAPGVGQTAATINSTAAANAPGSLVANYPIIPPSYTVATLPTPTAALAGARAFVTDQLSSLPAWGGALTGGGALVCPCWCTGAAGAWVAG